MLTIPTEQTNMPKKKCRSFDFVIITNLTRLETAKIFYYFQAFTDMNQTNPLVVMPNENR